MIGPVVFTPPFKQFVEGVASYFVEQSVDVVVERGWKARSEQINQGPGRANRVIFSGSKPDGSAGTITNPSQVGQLELGGDATADPPVPPEFSVRPLSDWERSLYVSVWAYDGDNPNDEGAQDDAVFQLFMWVQRAVQATVTRLGGGAVWGAAKFTVPSERAFGLELLVDLTFQHPIFDLPQEIGLPDPALRKGALP